MALDPVSIALEVGGKLIDKFFPDPAQRDAAKVKLLELQASGELAKMTNETELTKAFLGDVASAREREAKIVVSDAAPTLNKVVTPVLAIGIVTLTFLLCTILAFQADADLKPAQERIIIFVVGSLVPICVQVVSYYFGSSRGDAAKDQHLRDIMGGRNGNGR